MHRANPEEFRARVQKHLEEYRPNQVAAAKADGSLNNQVDSLSGAIADWINSQELDPRSLEHLSPEQQQREKISHRLLTESDAMRELLPRDEASEKLIGPSGGYEDQTSDSTDES